MLSLPTKCADSLAEVIVSRAYNLSGLRQLHIDYDNAEYYHFTQYFTCLPLLLTWPKNLCLLDAHMGSKPWLPPLKHVKHLILVLQDDIGNISGTLPAAKSLETLSISRSMYYRAEDPINTPLVLNLLPFLVSIALKNFCPDMLRLPEECKLTVHAKNLRVLKCNGWQSKEAKVCSISVKLSLPDITEFRKYVENLHALVSVAIHLNATATSLACMQSLDLCCLQHVKKLHVSGETLGICVPTKVSWDVLKVDASETLRLIAPDEHKRADAACPKFLSHFPYCCWHMASRNASASSCSADTVGCEQEESRGR